MAKIFERRTMKELTLLRLARLKAGLCQHEAALKSEISQSEISLFERELKTPTPTQLATLSRVYQVDLDKCAAELEALALNEVKDGRTAAR
jgi:transcriptional regulator with XRE-family HTH domain